MTRSKRNYSRLETENKVESFTVESTAPVGNWEKVLEPFAIDNYYISKTCPFFLCHVETTLENIEKLCNHYVNKKFYH